MMERRSSRSCHPCTYYRRAYLELLSGVRLWTRMCVRVSGYVCMCAVYAYTEMVTQLVEEVCLH